MKENEELKPESWIALFCIFNISSLAYPVFYELHNHFFFLEYLLLSSHSFWFCRRDLLYYLICLLFFIVENEIAKFKHTKKDRTVVLQTIQTILYPTTKRKKKNLFLIWDFETVSILIVRLRYASKVCVGAYVKKRKIKQLQTSSQFWKTKKKEKRFIQFLCSLLRMCNTVLYLRKRTDTMLTASYTIFSLFVAISFALFVIRIRFPRLTCAIFVCTQIVLFSYTTLLYAIGYMLHA